MLYLAVRFTYLGKFMQWSVDVLWLGMDQGEEKTGANISVCHATLPS